MPTLIVALLAAVFFPSSRLAPPAAVAGRAAAQADTALRQADALVEAVETILKNEPKGDARNARLEKLVDQLDALPGDFTAQRFTAHTAMLSYYRYDDLDGGIIKHSTWLIDAAKQLSPAAHAQYAPQVVDAYVDMAEAWAGEGMTDKALALLRRAPAELPDAPRVRNAVEPEIARYSLVGTSAAPITAPRWLNLARGRTQMSMTGAVTLLEFGAHWCTPCKESYPGVNRLRQKYGARGFRVVYATKLYGYFGKERPLTASAEIAHDRQYFAEHDLDIPIAIGDPVEAVLVKGKVEYLPRRDPNDEHYQVGGIPQIELIDKHGKIRLIMVGYDDANEARLGALIDRLLK